MMAALFITAIFENEFFDNTNIRIDKRVDIILAVHKLSTSNIEFCEMIILVTIPAIIPIDWITARILKKGFIFFSLPIILFSHTHL
ncbi:MAG: hypothetical protein K2I14_03475, partial [Eubacterium sp.]|nr:hypothetical protein [Eubacterium sp.]